MMRTRIREDKAAGYLTRDGQGGVRLTREDSDGSSNKNDGERHRIISCYSALISRATRLPDSRAPCIHPSIHTDVCSPAK